MNIDHLAPTEPLPPIQQLSYDPLTEQDLLLLNSLHLLQDPQSPTSSSHFSPSLSISSPSSPATSHHHNEQETPTTTTTAIKREPSTQDLFQDIDGLLAGDNSDQFLDSLGLGSSNSTTGGGVGDVDVSIFHPLDSAGRPIDNLELIQPVSFDLPEQEQEQEEEYRPFSSWRDDKERPSWVYEWFPPFPGAEKESDQSIQSRRRKEEKERERREQQQQQNAAGGGAKRVTSTLGGGDPWLEAVPFSSSILAESTTIFPNSLPTPSSPHRLPKSLDNSTSSENAPPPPPRKRPRRRSLSPPPLSTSLPSFNSIAPLLPHAPSYLRPSSLRRQAASLISHSPHHPELLISSDSLFGSLPYVPTLRQPTLPPGFLPDFAPPLIHAFNTNLPWTISSPVPYHSCSLPLPAPPPHSRIPSTLSQISRHLSFPLQFDPKNRELLHPNIPLFSRLNRIGPPGPLGAKGETLNYEFVGNTALIAMNVEWQPRTHDMKLPKRIGGNEAEGGVGEEGRGEKGIKLKLGSSVRGAREGSGSSRVGSPFVGGVGGTPGPSGLRRESVSFNHQSQLNEFDFGIQGGSGGGGGAQGGGGGELSMDDLNTFEKNLDHFPTTDSRRNSISGGQGQPFDISHLVPSQSQSQSQSQSGGTILQEGARVEEIGIQDDNAAGGGEVNYPSWLLSGEQPPTVPSTDAPQSEPIREEAQTSFSQPQPEQQDVKPRLDSMDYDMIDPSLGGSASTSTSTSTSTLPSLPPSSSTNQPPPSLPSLPSLPSSLPPTSTGSGIIRFKLKPPAPPPPPPPPAPAPAPVSMNMFDPSNLPPPPP